MHVESVAWISGQKNTLSVVLALLSVAAWVERHVIGAIGTEFTLSPVQRVLLAGRAVWHYLATFLWPSDLVFTYPRWRIEPVSVLAWAYPAATLVFVGMLFPVLGFLDGYPFRYSFVADHFQYHANVALCMLAGGGIAWLGERARPGAQRRVLALAAGIALLAFATIAGNPTSWMALHNLGRLVSRKPGGLTEAIAHLRHAVRLKPKVAQGHNTLGEALLAMGRTDDARGEFAVSQRRRLGGTSNNLAADYADSQRTNADPSWEHPINYSAFIRARSA